MKELIEWIDAKTTLPNRMGWFLVRGREYDDARIDRKAYEIAHYLKRMTTEES